ncbi:MAG: TylF/MycF/NovP-related O-methyltransferase [Pirellulales bacterium]
MPVAKSKSDGWDQSQIGYLKVSLEDVQNNIRRFGLLDEQVRFLQGWFENTLPQAPIQKLAILRLDGDMYSSTMDALTNLYHKVSPGGFVIVDDYGSWPACRAAISDFMKQRNIKVELRLIDSEGVYWQVPVSDSTNRDDRS